MLLSWGGIKQYKNIVIYRVAFLSQLMLNLHWIIPEWFYLVYVTVGTGAWLSLGVSYDVTMSMVIQRWLTVRTRKRPCLDFWMAWIECRHLSWVHLSWKAEQATVIWIALWAKRCADLYGPGVIVWSEAPAASEATEHQIHLKNLQIRLWIFEGLTSTL